ncbi:MAG: SDR family oxidoreductase [Bacteroidota bacterium]
MKPISELHNFQGRIFVMSGGTGVLGKTIVQSLLAWGATVALLSRKKERASQLFQDLHADASKALAVECDVLDMEGLKASLGTVLKTFGQIDGLINGAGGNDPRATTNPQQPFFQLPEEALRSVMDLNLLGTILPCQVYGKYFADRKEGVILNISSMSAVHPLTRVVGYSAAKAAVSNFTQWLAVHMAQEYSPNIRVNAMAPGFFLTEQNRFLLTDRETGALTERGRKIIDHTPLGRFGEPEDLVTTLAWLLSPGSKFVTGIVVPVDGGFSASFGV